MGRILFGLSKNPFGINMFCRQRILHASKATATYCKNTYRKPPPPIYSFEYDMDTPVPRGLLTHQRHRYDHRYYVREPLFKAGRNVIMDPKTYSLFSTTRGVMSLRQSNVRPSYRYVDIEPDIYKAYWTKHMRDYYRETNQYWSYNDQNTHVQVERHVMKKGKKWHEEIQRVMPLSERFQDPNLLARCPEKVQGPIIKERYVWD